LFVYSRPKRCINSINVDIVFFMTIPLACLFLYTTLMLYIIKQSFHQKLFKFHFVFKNACSFQFLFSIRARFYINDGHKVSYHLAAAACFSNENLWNPPPQTSVHIVDFWSYGFLSIFISIVECHLKHIDVILIGCWKEESLVCHEIPARKNGNLLFLKPKLINHNRSLSFPSFWNGLEINS